MDIKETQQELNVFTDYDEQQRERQTGLKNDLKPATITYPRTQTQQRKTETKLHDTTRL